jgi:alpha-mannosidase
MTSVEQQLRNKLNVPPTAKRVLILEQSAHCDWDWVETFETYYAKGLQPVVKTLNEAISYIQKYQGKPQPYVYTFCEMGFLRRYLHDNPKQAGTIKEFPAGAFNISSGGIVSADNLLSHGEAFIRNYLIGRQWVEGALGITPSLQMWIPDDFGHDAQLPVVLQAMGFMGAGFWRIPAGVGAPNVDPSYTVCSNAANVFLDAQVGLDFTWQAADGSSIQAHWLSNSYCEGKNQETANESNVLVWGNSEQGDINTFICQNLCDSSGNAIPQPTPYLFVPVDCDFCAPFTNLPDMITNWNNCNGWGTGIDCMTNPPYTCGVYAVMATFDDFMQLVQAYTAQGSGNNALSVLYSNPPSDPTLPAFIPNPYFCGAYGSRPLLKNLHYQATRRLLFAESMQIILNYLASTDPSGWQTTAAKWSAAVADAWDRLMPSTHHDYITGTSGVGSSCEHLPKKDFVYLEEQRPDLEKADQAALAALQGIVGAIATTVPAGAAVAPVAVFNSLGFSRSGVVESPLPADGGTYQSSTMDSVNYMPVQHTGRNTILLMAQAPSIGYQSLYLGDTAPTVELPLSLRLEEGSYVMENEFLSATISTSAQGITDLYDLSADPHRTTNLLNGTGNQIVFYTDNGNIYRFGNEIPESDSTFNEDTTLQLTNLQFGARVHGKLGVSLTVTGDLPNGSSSIPYEMQYELLAGESFLRMRTHGSPLPATGPPLSGYSVMVRFPFASAAQSLTYGTPYHWDSRAPRNFFHWPDLQVGPNGSVELMTFEPTHQFAIPVDANGNYLGAIYHAGVPAWAIDTQGRLLGCILRNAPGAQNAAQATDDGAYTATYAIRVPGSGANQLLNPASGCGPGSPLGEALQFNNPMIGIPIANNASTQLPPKMSIAATPGGVALVTAAKMGTATASDLVLRVYQPTNAPLANVAVEIDSMIATLYQNAGVLNVVAQTALETSLESVENLALQQEATSFSFTAPFALTTFALTPSTAGQK